MTHIPVLLKEVLEGFAPLSLSCFVDATLGGGGHAEAILETHPEIETFCGIDGDPEALEYCQKKLHKYKNKITLIQGNFRNFRKIVPCETGEGALFDIGLSSMQIDEGDKGFSFSRDAPLDMRKDPNLKIDAKKVINTFTEDKLGEIFRELGEERYWRKAAKAIVEARRKKPITTTFELINVLENVLYRTGKRHPMTLIFQALRIYVNDELKSLEEGICEAIEWLAPQGRLGVIAFHSLEDRIVKNLFRDKAKEKKVILLTKKPFMATREEIRINPRSRSARLRFIEKL